MPGRREEGKAGCSCGICACKEAPVDVSGRKFCSAACAEGTHRDSCLCGHPDCKPKPK